MIYLGDLCVLCG